RKRHTRPYSRLAHLITVRPSCLTSRPKLRRARLSRSITLPRGLRLAPEAAHAARGIGRRMASSCGGDTCCTPTGSQVCFPSRMSWRKAGDTMHTADMRDIVTSDEVLYPVTRLDTRQRDAAG